MKFARLAEIATEVVAAARRRLPPEVRAATAEVPVHFESGPAADVIAEGFEPDILGLFTGSAHGTELAHDQPAPPQILLYLDNLWACAEGDDDLFREETRLTYLHELGHYLGWDENDLTARGLE